MNDSMNIAVIGLGYVGLPLAVAFGRSRDVVGFDVNKSRIEELRNGNDSTFEVSSGEIAEAKTLIFSDNLDDIRGSNVFIVTVPTPIDGNNVPDLVPLKKASDMIARVLKKDDIVIYESTVYPGATEEICIPILESGSRLKYNKDFYAGYSPERINPGDKENTLTTIKKITSGSTLETAVLINDLYSSIITAGTHLASSIKVAEAAKVIENTQRDLNIAIINEFTKIFNILNIDTQEVLEAAGTKWNFLPFKPGLVGGHCISVDPYYLTHKATEVGYYPQVILAGRRINEGMASYVASQLVKRLSQENIHIDEARVLILGFTFKGDCPDVRNTKVINIVKELEAFHIEVHVHDHWACAKQVELEFGIKLQSEMVEGSYDAVIIAVDHADYKMWGEDKIRSFGKENHVVYDLKYVLPALGSDMRL
jgi:UDP-N-acetyl-D-glucosamine/UDP-N-acetyl-D-galactosamine dehydrogenase